MEVFDIHHHMGYLFSGEMPEISEDSTKRIEDMDRYGITRAGIMPSTCYYMPDGISDTKKVNEKMAEYKRQHPDRFPVAIGTVEPRHGQVSLEEIDRIIMELKLNGVVWHHRQQGAAIDDEITKLCLTRISELNMRLPVFIHNFSESTLEAPWRLENLAEAFPHLTFVSLSCLGSPDHIQRMLRLAKKRKNILLETGMMLPLGNIIERIVGEIGSHRLLFGTDTYSHSIATDVETSLEMIRKSKISDEDKANILAKNAMKIFGL